MNNTNTRHKKNYKKAPTFIKKTVVLGMLENAKYTDDDLVDVLSNITFDLININLTTTKENVGLQGNGYAVIGYVNKFNADDNTFDVVIFSKYADIAENIDDSVITARVFTDKEDKITKIIGLDLLV